MAKGPQTHLAILKILGRQIGTGTSPAWAGWPLVRRIAWNIAHSFASFRITHEEKAPVARCVSPARVEWRVLAIRSEQTQGGKHATMDSRPGTPRRRDLADGRFGSAAGVSAQSLVLLPLLLLSA